MTVLSFVNLTVICHPNEMKTSEKTGTYLCRNFFLWLCCLTRPVFSIPLIILFTAVSSIPILSCLERKKEIWFSSRKKNNQTLITPDCDDKKASYPKTSKQALNFLKKCLIDPLFFFTTDRVYILSKWKNSDILSNVCKTTSIFAD